MNPTRTKISTLSSIFLGLASLLNTAPSSAAESPSTADVLTEVHKSDQKEIDMGKSAEKHGKSKAVLNFGKMLVKDHTEADKKVANLAKKKNIDMGSSWTASLRTDMSEMIAGSDFDRHFAQVMLDDHRKDIEKVTKARDETRDEQLKQLLDELLPTLKKHEETAEKILDETKKP